MDGIEHRRGKGRGPVAAHSIGAQRCSCGAQVRPEASARAHNEAHSRGPSGVAGDVCPSREDAAHTPWSMHLLETYAAVKREGGRSVSTPGEP